MATSQILPSAKKRVARTCMVCGAPVVERNRWMYCGVECAAEGQRRVVEKMNQRREAAKVLTKKCQICSKEYRPNNASQKYCSDPCKAEGLQRAIERQRQRRQLAKNQPKED